ncbi:MAG: bifunctional metallophosphatase/5'-nucleotidase [bacterium]|nr:5'-nucleotidase/apyrase family protein [bacterium]MBU1917708.1 5'-nucleotidase/apyrase family protein [bacterium]
MYKYIRYPLALLIILSLFSISSDHSLNSLTITDNPEPITDFTLTIAHINDTHAHIEPSNLKLTFENKTQKVEAGGLARLVTKVKQLRADNKNFLFLHAGDLFQGTLYFKLFNGFADKYFFELAGLDAMVLGNHEFDKDTSTLEKFAAKSNFPLLSANIDFTTAEGLKKHIKPYIIKSFSQEKVGIIGLTTQDTTHIALGAKNIIFQDPITTAKKYIQELKNMGINKIILLTHLGINEDQVLAQNLTDVDLIIGGHSHTVLGDFEGIGITTTAPYPLVLKDAAKKEVLIVQAWNFAYILGRIDLTFNAQGEVTHYQGQPILMLGEKTQLATLPFTEVISEDPVAKEKLQEFTKQLDNLKNNVVATADEDLIRGLNMGPGPIIADAMLWKTKALDVQAAIINTGGTRDDLLKGPITIATAYTVLPFENTYIVMDLTGQEIIDVIEDNTTVQFTKGRIIPVNVAGLKYDVFINSKQGQRIQNVFIRNENDIYVSIDKNKTYRIVTVNFLAQGGDYNDTLKNAKGYRYDTGFIETEGFIDYIRMKKTISNITEKRIDIVK